MSMTAKSHSYIGIGGWTFEPWRGVFYPKGLTHAKELAYASARLTSIEVNGTFYSTQSPKTFRKWPASLDAGGLKSKHQRGERDSGRVMLGGAI